MDTLVKTSAIQSEQLQHLLSACGRTIVASMVAAAILGYIQRDVVATSVIVGWLIIVITINIFRFVYFRYWIRPATDTVTVRKQLMLFRFWLIVSSISWGAAGILMIPANNPLHQMLVIYLLIGMAAGSVVSYSADVVSAISYSVVTLTPVIIFLFLLGDHVYVAMGVAGFFFLIFMILSIYNINRNLIENIILRFEAAGREETIKQFAFYDMLTNLPNRRLLIDKLDHALAMSARSGNRGGLLFLDLDRFKVLNDTHGHDMGDLLLKQVAERLLSCVRKSDTVARLGGDEFVVMLEGLGNNAEEAEAQVVSVKQFVIAALNRPYYLNKLEYHCTCSVGIAMFDVHGQSHEELLKHADMAMYKQKKQGQ